MANPPQVPPAGDIHIAVQNLNFGSNIGGDQNAAQSSSSYQTFMAKHGAGYWFLHCLVAVAAAALWELLVHLLK